jgi:hypothetical protein
MASENTHKGAGQNSITIRSRKPRPNPYADYFPVNEAVNLELTSAPRTTPKTTLRGVAIEKVSRFVSRRINKTD